MTYASLIVLAYNRPDVMARSLETLWGNTRYPYELIILDDGSTEPGSYELLSKVVRKKMASYVGFNLGENRGIGTQFNRGCAIASGSYLLKLDADLMYKPGWLTEVVGLLEKYKEIGVLGLFKYWYEPCLFPNELIETYEEYHEVVDFVGSALCMRRGIYNTFGPWVEEGSTFSEDVRFKERVQTAGFQLALPLEDLVENVGFGEDKTSLIKTIDWDEGKHEYNVPSGFPRVFNS